MVFTELWCFIVKHEDYGYQDGSIAVPYLGLGCEILIDEIDILVEASSKSC